MIQYNLNILNIHLVGNILFLNYHHNITEGKTDETIELKQNEIKNKIVTLKKWTRGFSSPTKITTM